MKVVVVIFSGLEREKILFVLYLVIKIKEIKIN